MNYPCLHGHTIRGPLDLLPSGACRSCDRDRQRAYRDRAQLGAKLLKALHNRGIDLTDLDKAEKVVAAAAVLQLFDVDPAKAQRLMQRDPRLYKMALAMVDQLAKMTAK